MKHNLLPSSGLGVNVYASCECVDTTARRSRTLYASIPDALRDAEQQDALVLVEQSPGAFVAVPLDKIEAGTVRGRFGGRFIYTSDSRLREVADYPIPLYDSASGTTMAAGKTVDGGGILCEVYCADGYRSCALSGPTTLFRKVRVFSDKDTLPATASHGLDVLIVQEHRSVKGYFFAVPNAYKVRNAWTMMGGNFVYSDSPEFAAKFGSYPIPVHDRCETAAIRVSAGYESALLGVN